MGIQTEITLLSELFTLSSRDVGTSVWPRVGSQVASTLAEQGLQGLRVGFRLDQALASVLSTDDWIASLRGLITSETTDSTDENRANQERLQQLRQRFTGELLTLIRDDEFEYGLVNRVDLLVRQQMAQNALATKDWLNSIFLENQGNAPILLGLLHAIARLDYWEVYPEGQTMAIAALSHANVEVQECGVRAFENWAARASLDVLENLRVATGWLQEYIDEVVADLRRLHGVRAC